MSYDKVVLRQQSLKILTTIIFMEFEIGGPVKKSFVDREKEIKLIKRGIDNNNYAIIGVRRTGKTSLILRVMDDLDEKLIPVYLDVSFVAPLNEINFLKTFMAEVMEAYSKRSGEKHIALKFHKFLEGSKEFLVDLLKSTHISIRDTVEVWFKNEEEKNLTPLIKSAFELPEKLGKEKGVKFLVIFDEFTRLLELRDGEFIWALRSYIHRSESTHYIISSSSVSAMRHILEGRESPFFGTLMKINLEGLSESGFEELIGKLDKSLDEDAKEYLKRITGCYPLYLQAFCYLIELDERERIEKRDVSELTEDVFRILTPHFECFFNEIKGFKRDVLIKIAVKDLKTAEALAKELDKPNNYINSYLRRLEEEGFIERKKIGIYDFADPFFKAWIKKNAIL